MGICSPKQKKKNHKSNNTIIKSQSQIIQSQPYSVGCQQLNKNFKSNESFSKQDNNNDIQHIQTIQRQKISPNIQLKIQESLFVDINQLSPQQQISNYYQQQEIDQNLQSNEQNNLDYSSQIEANQQITDPNRLLNQEKDYNNNNNFQVQDFEQKKIENQFMNMIEQEQVLQVNEIFNNEEKTEEAEITKKKKFNIKKHNTQNAFKSNPKKFHMSMKNQNIYEFSQIQNPLDKIVSQSEKQIILENTIQINQIQDIHEKQNDIFNQEKVVSTIDYGNANLQAYNNEQFTDKNQLQQNISSYNTDYDNTNLHANIIIVDNDEKVNDNNNELNNQNIINNNNENQKQQYLQSNYINNCFLEIVELEQEQETEKCKNEEENSEDTIIIKKKKFKSGKKNHFSKEIDNEQPVQTLQAQQSFEQKEQSPFIPTPPPLQDLLAQQSLQKKIEKPKQEEQKQIEDYSDKEAAMLIERKQKPVQQTNQMKDLLREAVIKRHQSLNRCNFLESQVI